MSESRPQFIVRTCVVNEFADQIAKCYRDKYLLHSWNIHEAQSNGPTYGIRIKVVAVYEDRSH